MHLSLSDELHLLTGTIKKDRDSFLFFEESDVEYRNWERFKVNNWYRVGDRWWQNQGDYDLLLVGLGSLFLLKGPFLVKLLVTKDHKSRSIDWQIYWKRRLIWKSLLLMKEPDKSLPKQKMLIIRDFDRQRVSGYRSSILYQFLNQMILFDRLCAKINL
jgi:hypothetical protein